MLKSTCTNVVQEVNAKLDCKARSYASNQEKATTLARPVISPVSSITTLHVRDQRKLNVVVHNLPEEEDETSAERSANDQAAFQAVVKKALRLRVVTTKSFCVGKQFPGKPRLLTVTIASLEAKLDLLPHGFTAQKLDLEFHIHKSRPI